MKLNELFSKPKKTLYVKRKLLNTDEIIEWAKSQGFEHLMDPSEFHATIVFSKEPFDYSNISLQNNKLVVNNTKDRKVEHLGDKGAIVLKFFSETLHNRWQEFRNEGASWDYDSYQPHVTLSYEDNAVNVEEVEPFKGKLIFGKEIGNPVDDDWADKIKTVDIS